LKARSRFAQSAGRSRKDPVASVACDPVACRERDLIAPGDRLVWLRGFLPDDPTHNGMRIQVVT
jgi:hypothetical protein